MRQNHSSGNDWDLSWNQDETMVIFKLINKNEEAIKEFSLGAPDYARLYYALKDWFGD